MVGHVTIGRETVVRGDFELTIDELRAVAVSSS